MFKFYLDLFEEKTLGIFHLLDNECKLKQPNLKNFKHAVIATHKNKIIQERAKTELNGFTIRHFAQDVQYCCVRILKRRNFKTHRLSLCLSLSPYIHSKCFFTLGEFH